MNVGFSSSFNKAFSLLSRRDQEMVMDTIDFFREDPWHQSLRNHPLTGSMTGKNSISVKEDLRIIFIEKGDYIEVLMLDVGDHPGVYFG